jgi:hypothetical protein
MLAFTVAAGLLAASAVATTSEHPSPFLNFSSPAPYIFSSVSGLFHQWSNSFFPNGHTIAACEIPKHTLFYHGRLDADDPPSPEWLAFDIEMSYGIMGSMPNSRMLTYRTTQTVKCLYFDGTSANLMGSGTEAQMTFLYGDSDSIPSRGPRHPRRPPGRSPGGGHHAEEKADDDRSGWDPLADEYFRARGLCNWIKDEGLGGLGWGYEGIIRMNAGFELIWCDFESPSLQLISNLNVSVPRIQGVADQGRTQEIAADFIQVRRGLQQISLGSPAADVQAMDEGPHGPGMTDPSEPFRGVAHWMWFAAATRRYGMSGIGLGRGEARARVETCGLFTFYDPQLSDQDDARIQEERSFLNISSDGRWNGSSSGLEREQALENLMRRRRWHRPNHVSKDDGVFMRAAVKNRLMEAQSGENKCSGIDWQLTSQEIVAFYSNGLQDLFGLLRIHQSKSEQNWLSARNWLESIRVTTHWFMLPFFEYPPGPYTNQTLQKDFSLHSAAARAAILRCQYQYTANEPVLSDSEKLLSWTTQEILGGICNTIFEVGLAVESEWLLNFNTDPSANQSDGSMAWPVMDKADSWKEKIEELMAWLGWVEQWTSCQGPCASTVSHTSRKIILYVSLILKL